MRLQVFLSRNGVCSRRNAMAVIQDGNVKVNCKQVLEPSFDVDPDKDNVSVDGRKVSAKKYTYLMLNKPSGYVTTKADRFAEKTVYDLLPEEYHHLSPVGRLDKDTEGLLILTNDGDFGNSLSHPSFDVDKKYFVRAEGVLDNSSLFKIEKGIVIEDKKTSPAKISAVKTVGGNTEFFLTIHEGRKRQIRRMLEKVGYKVIYLKRTEQGKYKLGNLKTGEYKTFEK